MTDATEYKRVKFKLEWACSQIEHLLKEVSMLKNPEFWRLEAARQKCLLIGDPCRTMSEDDMARFLRHQDVIAWSRPIWSAKSEAGQPPRIQNWWIPSPKQDKSDPTVTPGFAIARCVINGQEYAEVSCYLPRFTDLYEDCIDGNTAMSCVGRKLVDRLCREGVLTTECSRDNPTGEPRIL